MAQLYVSGPVAVHIQSVFDAQPRFLGHGEVAPQINIHGILEPVRCDVGGTADFDEIYAGESAEVSCDMARFNFPVYQAIQSRARTALFPNAVGGFDEPGMVGELMVAGGAAFILYLSYLFAFKPSFQLGAGGPMRLGYRFKNAILETNGEQGGSARLLKPTLRWKCVRSFDPTARNAFGFGSFTLYDQNVAAAVAVGIN